MSFVVRCGQLRHLDTVWTQVWWALQCDTSRKQRHSQCGWWWRTTTYSIITFPPNSFFIILAKIGTFVKNFFGGRTPTRFCKSLFLWLRPKRKLGTENDFGKQSIYLWGRCEFADFPGKMETLTSPHLKSQYFRELLFFENFEHGLFSITPAKNGN